MEEISKRLAEHGIRVRKIEPNDVDILSLIDDIDMNIEYWQMKGSIYKERVQRLIRLKLDLWEMLE